MTYRKLALIGRKMLTRTAQQIRPKESRVAAIVESHPFSSPRLARAVGRAAFRSSQPGTSTRPRRPPQRARPHPCQPGQPQAPPHANSFDSNDNGFVRPISHPARIAPPTHKSAQSRPIAHNRRKPPAPNPQPRRAKRAPPTPLLFSANLVTIIYRRPLPKAGYK